MTGDAPVDRAGDTAQVVLVGAVAIAFIIIGLVLVANTVLFTESVGSERSLGATDEAGEFQRLARDETANVVYRVNSRNNFSARGDLDDAVQENVSELNGLLATEFGQRNGVFVNVSVDLSNSEYGARIDQDDEAAFNNTAGGGNDWNPVSSGSATQVAEFGATFNVSEMPEVTNLATLPVSRSVLPFELTVDGASGQTFLYVFNDSGNLSIAESGSSIGTVSGIQSAATGACERIDVSSSNVYVDFTTGRVPGTDCTFNGTAAADAPLSLSFDNADNAVGTYSFVVEDDDIATAGKYDDFDGTDTDDPYSSFVYWEVGTTVTYEGPELSYNVTRTLQIYAPDGERRYTSLLAPIDDTAGADTGYRMNFSVSKYAPGQVGDSLDQIEIEILNASATGTFDDVDGVEDIEEIGIDTDGDGEIDEVIPDSEIDQVQVQNGGREVEIDFVGSDPSTNNIEAEDDILITFSNATNPTIPPQKYGVEVRPSTGSGRGTFNVSSP